MGKIKILNKIFNKCGFNITRLNVNSSNELRIIRLLNYYNIDFVLDVGANKGEYGKALRELNFKGEIISFEPIEEVYRQLKSVAESDQKWKVPNRIAIGDKNQDTIIHVSENIASSSINKILKTHIDAEPTSQVIREEKIEMRTLDSLIGEVIPLELKNSFLKIDVQGFEWEVLVGA